MTDDANNVINECIDRLLRSEDTTLTRGVSCRLPDREKVQDVISTVRKIIYPNFFSKAEHCCKTQYQALLSKLYDCLYDVVYAAFAYDTERSGEIVDKSAVTDRSKSACYAFIAELPEVLRLTALDIKATLSGDPAAENPDIIILTYPGTEAVFIYRVAHVLYKQGVPFVPRMMTEHAHFETGIDINPGASIGESVVIDHGTGVVIGETTVIGNHVKIYQGVTLGAKSLADARSLVGVKRHPTIEDNVTIYSGATVLGGETVIGKGAVIGSSVFLTSSVPENVTVAIEKPKLRLYKNNPF